jgi:hypothetical protein
MRTPIIVAVLTLALGGLAQAQTERQAVPTDECTPGSMQVILGLCTASQREQAKTLNTDRAPPAPTPPRSPQPHKAAPPAHPGGATISVHFSAAEVAAIDAWIASQPDKGDINRAEAVHRLLRTSLPQSDPHP